MSTVFKALSDPTRRRVLQLLREGPRSLVDSETVTRVISGTTGLMIASYGNRMPKVFVPSTRARQITRVAAWSLVLSGLVYAGLWAFAPIPVAIAGGCAAVLSGMAVTIGYCLSLRRRASTVWPSDG